MSKVNSKETGGPGHLGDPGYENGEGGYPGGQAEEMDEEGLLESSQGGSLLLPSPPKGALEPKTMKR